MPGKMSGNTRGLAGHLGKNTGEREDEGWHFLMRDSSGKLPTETSMAEGCSGKADTMELTPSVLLLFYQQRAEKWQELPAKSCSGARLALPLGPAIPKCALSRSPVTLLSGTSPPPRAQVYSALHTPRARLILA